MTHCFPLLASLYNGAQKESPSVITFSLQPGTFSALSFVCQAGGELHTSLIEHSICTTKLLEFLKYSFNETDH